jgi:pyruvate/2-oxoglutarate dehydrogenase complex dihydrolipoamide acyltransferase (E2) component
MAHWYKQDGDDVTQGEPLFAIETDKATLDIRSLRQWHPGGTCGG